LHRAAGELPREQAVVAVARAVGHAVDHGMAAARQDQELVLVAARVGCNLGFGEGLDAHRSRSCSKDALRIERCAAKCDCYSS
jgi:hypothetical protein